MFKRIDHIGVVVDDLAEARAFLESLGMVLERAQEVPERQVKIAFYHCGDGRIELIEPTTPEARERRLGEGKQATIEHIGVEVDDVPSIMRAVQGLGVELTTSEPVPVGPNLNAWTQPGTSKGIQFQLVQRDAV
ncbi:methylmalonyl-CoA epimerase [Streptomyces longisporoflavus]|uniref:VOC family protein n=1 Tax=Streptomyces longisporoflavus TaxID=28044 RepID=UPI00167D35A8|nr:VOC family protein [Streptomyces longisporoflavus]GGV58316.1 methylmalonyl-CoA epimerase [Streptomyces longisporoflavus]